MNQHPRPSRCKPGWASRSCRDVGAAAAVDTLLVSGGKGPEGLQDPAVLDWLRQTAPEGATLRLDLHRRVCAGRRRPHCRQARDDALEALRRTCATQSHRESRDRFHFRPRWQTLQLGGDFGGDRSGAGAARRGSRQGPGSGGRALSRAVPQALRRPGAILYAAPGAVFVRAGDPQGSALVPRQSRARSPCSCCLPSAPR